MPAAARWARAMLLSVLCALLHPASMAGGGDRPRDACARDEHCSGNGRCIDGGVCLCEYGWFGGNCSRALEGWAKMHRLEHNFYEHDAFKSRYVLAAHHLRHCRHIVEIGGYRTPISSFLRSQHESVTTIDPYIKPLAADSLNGAPCRVRHLPMMFEDYRLRGDEDCFLYIGLDYYDEENRPACGQLKTIVHGFQTVVVDYAARYPTGAACFQALELPAAFDRVASVLLEVEGNDWGDLSGSWLPTGLTTRAFYALRHRAAPPLTAGSTKTFSSPSQYSGNQAPDAEAVAVPNQRAQQQAPRSSSPAQTSADQVLARAGGALGRDASREDVHGWSLPGLVDAPKQEQEHAEAQALPPVDDAWSAAIENARLRRWHQAGGYWAQHVRALGLRGALPHVSQVFEFAMALFNGHQVQAALPLLAKVVEMEPRDARGYNNLAMAYESLGEQQQARKALETGLSHEPDHYSLNYNMGKQMLDLDKAEEAVAHFQRAAAGAPDHADVHFYLGSALRQVGRDLESKRAYDTVLRINPKYVYRYINTETNDLYQEFVRDEQVLLEQACTPQSATMCLLRSIVSQLRKMETSLEFIGDRQMDGRKTQILTGYMKHSFAYGSTFYQSWVQVFKNDVLVEAVEHMRSTGKLYGVLGSSVGWHVFYGVLTWQVRARGWEILCSQVEIAKSLALAHGLDNRTRQLLRLLRSECPTIFTLYSHCILTFENMCQLYGGRHAACLRSRRCRAL